MKLKDIVVGFPDFSQGWTPSLQNEKQEEGEKAFLVEIESRIESGDILSIADSNNMAFLLSMDIVVFWKKMWSDWNRNGGRYYDQAIGSINGEDVWFICEPVLSILALGREEFIRRVCDPEDELELPLCQFGSANWTEFAEQFGREVFRDTDKEECFESWYAQGWEAFEKTVDIIVAGYERGI